MHPRYQIPFLFAIIDAVVDIRDDERASSGEEQLRLGVIKILMFSSLIMLIGDLDAEVGEDVTLLPEWYR